MLKEKEKYHEKLLKDAIKNPRAPHLTNLNEDP